MHIAQIAPLYESVPPKLYGGTERVVSYLTEELVRQGHEVTLFASGDSQTLARLEPIIPTALRLDSNYRDPMAHHMVLLDRVLARAPEFDILHFHIDPLHFPLTRVLPVPHVTTLHGRLDLPDLVHLYQTFREVPVVSISEDQRLPLPGANWVGTVHHGLPSQLYPFHPAAGDYLAFIGRISPEKGVDRAIEIALQAGVPLRIAAKVDKVDREYYETVIQPMLRHPLIEHIGEIGDADKGDFLGRARALIFPINWPEPFGLAVIEALACGTPVIAYPNGALPEIVRDGETGFLVDSIAQGVSAVERIGEIDRAACRRDFEQRFAVERMARNYLNIYRRLIQAK